MAKSNSIHVDVPLSNLAVRAFNSGMGQFIAPFVFPTTDVPNQSDLYYVLQSGAFLRVHDTMRSKKTKARRIEFEVSSDNYFAKNYALSTDNALEDLANADRAIMLRENGTDLVVTGLLRDYEQRVANIVTSISNVGSGVVLSGGSKWSDYVSSDPIADVTTGSAFIRGRTGLKPNTAIIDTDTIQILRRHPAILEMFKYSKGGFASIDDLKTAFEVQNIFVGDAIKENSLEGNSTSSITNIWGNTCVLAHLNPPQGMKTVTLGLGMRWQPNEFPAAMSTGRQRFEGPGTENIEVIESQYFQAEKIVARDLGYAITTTL